MSNRFSRSELILGTEGMEKLSNSSVALFGVGGVGSFTAEALARTGIGKIILIDYDIIDISNINRQIHATTSTIGRYKVDVMKERLIQINPDIEVVVKKEKYGLDTKDMLLNPEYDYIVDAIDMISSKLDLIQSAKTLGIPIISSMGAGNKLNPTQIKVSDIYSTSVDPMARVMRNELKKRGVKSLKVVWSDEIPMKINMEIKDLRKAIPGSICFVPPVFGLIIGSEVIKDLIL